VCEFHISLSVLEECAPREVTTAQGQALAAEWGCAFVECSAKVDHNIGTA
jgi:hypothetical protein